MYEDNQQNMGRGAMGRYEWTVHVSRARACTAVDNYTRKCIITSADETSATAVCVSIERAAAKWPSARWLACSSAGLLCLFSHNSHAASVPWLPSYAFYMSLLRFRYWPNLVLMHNGDSTHFLLSFVHERFCCKTAELNNWRFLFSFVDCWAAIRFFINKIGRQVAV